MSTTTRTIDEILHLIIMAGIGAASIFVKNPASQQKAGQIAQLINEFLPVADGLLNPPTPPTA